MHDITKIILEHYHNLEFFGHTSRIPSWLLVELCQYPFEVPLGILAEMLRHPLEFLWETPLSYLDQFIQNALRNTSLYDPSRMPLSILQESFQYLWGFLAFLQKSFRILLEVLWEYLQDSSRKPSGIRLRSIWSSSLKVLPNL